MQTCSKCGSLMIPQKVDDEIVNKCMSCGATSQGTTTISEAATKKKEVEIFETEDTDRQYPTMEVECPKCKHNEAYWWTQQTRASDEPPTRFFKCVKCKHTWREY